MSRRKRLELPFPRKMHYLLRKPRWFYQRSGQCTPGTSRVTTASVMLPSDPVAAHASADIPMQDMYRRHSLLYPVRSAENP